VLDDLKMIHGRDGQDMLGLAEKQTMQLTYEFELKGSIRPEDIQNVVYNAMGGSALPALFAQSWPGSNVPLELVRGYDLPAYVGNKTLFIASSFSGNTEETLSALVQAEDKGAQIAVITNGGELQRIAEEKGYLLALLPQSFSRLSLLYNFRALLQILEKAAVLQDDFRPQLKQAANTLEEAVAVWRPDVRTVKNPAKQIAQELIGKSIVVYSGPRMYAAAYKWKINCNESAKQVAWVNQYPELNHNELTGWSKQPTAKPYAVIELRSSLEHPRVQKRFEVTERLLSGMRPAPIGINVEGETLLEQLLWAALLGDFVGVYLALLNGLDPAPLPLVDTFKHALA